jgi:hypothetical protein
MAMSPILQYNASHDITKFSHTNARRIRPTPSLEQGCADKAVYYAKLAEKERQRKIQNYYEQELLSTYE